MAAPEPLSPPHLGEGDAVSAYLGLSFAAFLALLPDGYASHAASLRSRNCALALQLARAEDQIRQLLSRRKEDSKANARVVEIFASHRNAWQREERRLLGQADAAAEEAAGLRTRVAELEGSEAELRAEVERLKAKVSEREEMIDLMSRKAEPEEDEGGRDGTGEDFVEKEVEMGEGKCEKDVEEYGMDYLRMGHFGITDGCVSDDHFLKRSGEFCGEHEMVGIYGRQNGFGGGGRELFFPSASQGWSEKSNGWQDLHCESPESLHPAKHFVPRRESPWKVDGESTGVSSKLKILEQELTNFEKVGKGELSKVSLLMRKQSKRYHSLAGKVDDLCRRMQVSDPSEPTLSPEFRTQRQTEFLLEAFRLQHRATETRQKLSALQTETTSCCVGDELTVQSKLDARKSLESMRSNFKDIQRNLEVWLARIMGDLEGILAREGASHVRDYYVSRYPFVR